MAKARRLKHPITVFIVTVLVVIGIGVGVVAATTDQTVYGPPWGRFTVSFSGHVYQTKVRSKISFFGKPNVSPTSVTVTSFSYSNQPHFGWYAYAPGTGAVFSAYDQYSVSVSNWLPMRQVLNSDRKDFFRRGVIEDDQIANGLSVVTIGPQCADGECNAAKVVSSGRVVWNVEAFWNGPASTVQGFVDSFAAIG